MTGRLGRTVAQERERAGRGRPSRTRARARATTGAAGRGRRAPTRAPRAPARRRGPGGAPQRVAHRGPELPLRAGRAEREQRLRPLVPRAQRRRPLLPDQREVERAEAVACSSAARCGERACGHALPAAAAVVDAVLGEADLQMRQQVRALGGERGDLVERAEPSAVVLDAHPLRRQVAVQRGRRAHRAERARGVARRERGRPAPPASASPRPGERAAVGVVVVGPAVQHVRRSLLRRSAGPRAAAIARHSPSSAAAVSGLWSGSTPRQWTRRSTAARAARPPRRTRVDPAGHHAYDAVPPAGGRRRRPRGADDAGRSRGSQPEKTVATRSRPRRGARRAGRPRRRPRGPPWRAAAARRRRATRPLPGRRTPAARRWSCARRRRSSGPASRSRPARRVPRGASRRRSRGEPIY